MLADFVFFTEYSFTALPLKMGQISRSETSARNDNSSLLKILKESGSYKVF